MQIRVLGPVDVVGRQGPADVGGPRQRRLLAALAAHPNEVVSTDRLVEIVWEDDPPDTARRVFRTYVNRLRRTLEEAEDGLDGNEIVLTRSPGYSLIVGDEQLDVLQAGQLVAEARRRRSVDPDASARLLAEALDLWRGQAFGEFAHEEWASPEVARLGELEVVAAEELCAIRLELGDPAEVVPDLRRLIGDHPLRDGLRVLEMVALNQAGRQADALRAFQEYRQVLAETGLEPSERLLELEGQIATRDPSLEITSGRRVRDYRLVAKIGSGAFGDVYRGNQPSLDRMVAVKVIRPELADDAEFVRRFEAEAHLVAKLEHPRIVPLYDYWREPGAAYLVMRWMRGGTVADQIQTGPLSVEAASRLVDHAGDALRAAHRAGVVHGDVKPANILTDDEGAFYLGDFGLAGLADTGSGPLDFSADIAGLARTVRAAVDGNTDVLSDRVAALLDHPDRFESVDEFVAAFHAAVADTEPPRRQDHGAFLSNPYVGLRPFTEGDAATFFGREDLIDRLLGRVAETRWLTVVGPSGSGKSSVVRAGLLPALRSGRIPGSDRWFLTTMIPGPKPFEELETALLRVAVNPPETLLNQLTEDDRGIARAVSRVLPDRDGQLTLVLDQFEELFTLVEADERERFLAALAAAVCDERSQLRVISTLRADFYDRPLRSRAIADLLRDGTEVITPMTHVEIESAIVQPAHACGAIFEGALAARIAADVTDQPAALPLLQYALSEIFERNRSGMLTAEAYDDLGGVHGALTTQADAVLAGLDPTGREAARHMFARLVTLGEGVEDTRRRVPLSDLPEDGAARDAIEAFATARLLTYDRDPTSRAPTVEVAHEALIREWPTLRSWLDDDRDSLRLLRRLSDSAAAWDSSGRDHSELYRGARLSTASDWATTHPDQLTMVETEFVEAGRHADQDARNQERRTNRRLRGLLIGTGVFLALALVAGGIALVQRSRAIDNEQAADLERIAANDAREEADIERIAANDAREEADLERIAADDAREEADVQRLSAEVVALTSSARLLASDDPVTAMLLAVQASARGSADDPAIASALLEALSADPRERSIHPPVQSVGLSLQPPSGSFYTYVFVVEEGARIDVLDTDDGTTRSVNVDFVPGAALTEPTGRYLFVVFEDRVFVHDTATGVLLADRPVEELLVAEFGHDGDDIAAATPDGRIVVQTLPSFDVITSVEGLPGLVRLTRSGDGRVVAANDEAGNLLIVSVDGSDERRVVPLPGQPDFIALDTTGGRLAVSTNRGPTALVDLTDPDAPPVIIPVGAESDLGFSPDGRLLAVGTGDGIEIFEAATGEPAAEPLSFATAVTFRFTGDRSLQAFAPNQGIVAIDLDAASRIVTETDVPGWGGVGFLAPDLSRVVALADDENGVFTQYLVTDPTDAETMTWTTIGPTSDTWNSRPLFDEGYITADTERLRYEEWDDAGLVQVIDLTGFVTQGFEHDSLPRIGSVRDILILADRAAQRTEVVVIDRERAEVLLSLRDIGMIAAEFVGEDEDEIIVGDISGRVRWLDLDGIPVADEMLLGSPVSAFAVMADRSLTAVGDLSGTLTLLDREHQVIAELVNDAPDPVRIAFIGEGARLAVQSQDGSIVLWDIETASRIGTLYRTNNLRGPFEVSPDGSSIVVAMETGIAKISTDPAEWERIACETANRTLTEAELHSVVPGVELIDDPCSRLR